MPRILLASLGAIGVALIAYALLNPAGTSAATCEDGPQPSGAIYRICMPADWNGSLVIWAHGYVDPSEPIAIPESQLTLPDGTSIVDIASDLNYAFATTSYRYNGLAVPWAVQDLLEVVDIFSQKHGAPSQTFLVGASEGGFATTLAVENYPEVFDGGLAACGPVGDFRQQVNYFGDFLVVFQYFFPGVLPIDDVTIPQEVIDNWDSVYEPAVKAAIAANPIATQQVLSVTGAPTDPNDPSTIEETVVGLLWYNVHATNDANAKLQGNPFDNTTRVYSGSNDDAALNAGVQRFSADPIAIQILNYFFKTTGDLSSPLVTLHTSGDPIVPAWHETYYSLKTIASGSLLQHFNVPVDRYGHCNFQASEAVLSLIVLQILVLINGD